MAALAVGASLWTAGNQLNLGDRQVHRAGGQIGTRWNGDPPIPPGSPAFFKQGTSGLLVSDWQDVILVKEHGKRFADEVLRAPLGSVAWRKHINAALAWTGDPKKLNGGGPVWAIFDSEAAAREEWRLEPPYVDPDGGYFFVGDTRDRLATSDLTQRVLGASPSEIMEVRLMLEPHTAHLAALRASAADLERMAECLDQALRAEGIAEFEFWDGALHEAIVKSVRNDLLSGIYEAINGIRNQPEWRKLKERTVGPEQRAAYQLEHAALVNALRERDADRASQLMRAHLLSVRRNLLSI